jgi:hypothetical protein
MNLRLDRTHSGNLGGSRALIELRTDGHKWAWFRSKSGGGARVSELRDTRDQALGDLSEIIVPCSNCTEPAMPGVGAQWSKV